MRTSDPRVPGSGSDLLLLIFLWENEVLFDIVRCQLVNPSSFSRTQSKEDTVSILLNDFRLVPPCVIPFWEGVKSGVYLVFRVVG